MSRTRKGSKSKDFAYSSGRGSSFYHSFKWDDAEWPGPEAKRITHRKERRMSDRLCQLATLLILCSGCLGPSGVSVPIKQETGRKVVVAVIEDSLKRDSKSPQIDYAFWKKLGCEFNLIEAKSERATHFKTQAERTGMPAMVIYDAETMLVLKSAKLPDKDGIASAVVSAKSKPRIPQEKK